MSELKITGKIKKILDPVTGESKDGNQWKKVEFVVTNNEGYEVREQIFCFQIFGAERVDKFLEYNKVGNDVDVKFNIKVNEYKGKYYTNLDAWSVFGVQGQGTPKPVQKQVQEPVSVVDEPDDLDSLPF